MKNLGRFFSYISENLREEINNFPLFIPVFIGAGIGYYFHLENEPSSLLVNIIFAISMVMLLFVNFGNSSDRVKHYKFVVFFSTLKYVLKKLIKFLLFALLFPIIGHITLVILVGGWVVSLFEYSKFLRYFALLYDNSLIKGIGKLIKFLFSPLVNRMGGKKIEDYSKDVLKKSHKKKKPFDSVWHLIIDKTKKIAGKISDWIFATFDNAVFRCIRKYRRKFYRNLKKIWIKCRGKIQKFIPRTFFVDGIKFLLSLNYVLFFFILGVFVIKLATDRADTVLLEKGIDNAVIKARVVGSEFFENGYRLTFDNVKVLDEVNPNLKEKELDKIRVKFDRKYGLPNIGKTLIFETSLIPPFEPMYVGGFNFARYAYFKKLSASGRANGGWQYVKDEQDIIKNTWLEDEFFKFLDLRNKINFMIEREVSEDISGVIMSMMTGERYSVPESISESYKGAGISHLLAISGFHMTLIVGVAFFLIRLLLVLYSPLAMKYNTKKIAVWFALIFSFFYLFISGARLPTERAFIMTTLALFAVFLDRNPLSLRFVAVSAIAILLLSPDALVNAGFQMSFVAVVVLIRIYEVRDRWIIKSDEEEMGVVKKFGLKIVNGILATAISAFFIGLAIMPFVVYNFNTVQIYSVFGNIFVIPIFSFIVMPAILFAFLMMPMGWEGVFLRFAEFGVEKINYCAERVAELPYSSIDVKSMGISAFIFILLGMIWLFLWNRRWRILGMGFIIFGYGMYCFAKTPDILVNRFGTMFAVNNRENKSLDFVMLGRQKVPSKMLLDDWLLHMGIKNWQVVDNRNFDFDGQNVGFVANYRDYKYECQNNNMLFVSFYKNKAFYKCRKFVFDRAFWNRARGAEFYLGSNKKWNVKTVAQYVGNRPWTYDYKFSKNNNFDNVLNMLKK